MFSVFFVRKMAVRRSRELLICVSRYVAEETGFSGNSVVVGDRYQLYWFPWQPVRREFVESLF